LLLNTLTYTPPGGKVWLRSYVDDACVCIEVADTGIGIAPEAAGRVFEPFYKADPARNVGDGGVGLGLAIVQRVVELHHGTVTLDSTPGRGSTFTIRLPASTPVLMPVTA